MRPVRLFVPALLLIATAVSAQTPAPPMSRATLLVSTAWVADHLTDPDLVLLHVGDPKEYAAAHIPGARLIAMDDVSAPLDRANMKPGELIREMPSPELLRERLQSFGVSDRSRIVVYYGGTWYTPATRIMAALTYAGLADRTQLLDGGLQAWVREQRSTTTDVPPPAAPGVLSPLRVTPFVVDAAFVQSRAGTSGIAIVDARDRVFYDGTKRSSQDETRAGHIPGALNVPFSELFDDLGSLRPAAELEGIFRKAGVKPGDTVVTYCHIGQQATAALLAARTLGHSVLLYDGSMDDWDKRKLPLALPRKAPRE